jgi:type II secretory pathway pseudopilin PulG
MSPEVRSPRFANTTSNGEEGYLLLGAIVAIALVMIALSVAAVKVSFALRREREVESARRAQQYVRAIREYYLKFGRYPGSVEQLENTNNIRFLRQKYVDPLTGKPDYRLIIVGQNKTQATGFFGEPLSGLPGSGAAPGSGSGAQANGTGTNAPGGNGAGTTGFGTANGPASSIGNNTATMGFGNSSNSVASGTQANGQGTASTGTGTGPQTAGSNSSSSATGIGSNSSGPGSNLGPIMGVGSSATGNAILAVNGQTTYETWEFLYDPRVERLRQAAQLNQGVQSTGGNQNGAGLGVPSQPGTTATPGSNTPAPGAGVSTPPANGTPPTQP